MPDRCWYLLSKSLSGEASHAELTELREMLNEDAEFAAKAKVITTYWNNSQHFEGDNFLLQKHLERKKNQLVEEFVLKNNPSVKFSTAAKVRWWIGAAATVIVIMVSYFVLRNTSPLLAAEPRQLNLVTTEPGSRTKVSLPDGSEVWVNADSKITYGKSFGRENRELWLEGEAFFDVKKNIALPFIIHTSRFKVQVTGTAFNVRAYPLEKASETALIRGQIIVTLNTDSNKHYVLKPAEKLRVHDDMVGEGKLTTPPTRINTDQYKQATIVIDKITFSKADSQILETAWVKNRLVFEDESFRAVADKMEHWYGVNITFTDKKLENEVLRGSFINESITDALAYLSFTTRFDYIVDGNNIIIKPRK